jgi:hypothetical protein
LLLAVISALSIGGALLFLDAARPPLPDDLTVIASSSRNLRTV